MEHQTRATVELRYCGNAAKSHTMSVGSLASSLDGLAAAVGEYRDLVLPLMALDTTVEAMRTRRGTFVVTVALVGDPVGIARAAGDAGNAGEGAAVAADVTDIAAGFVETIGIFKRRVLATGDPLPGSAEYARATDAGMAVSFRDGDDGFIVGRDSYSASKSIRLAKYLGRAFGSFASIDIDTVTACAVECGRSLDVPAGTAKALREVETLVEVHEPLIETRQLQIDTIQFSSDKWRFKDGDDKYYARIADAKFLAQWNRGDISFKNGDTLHAKVQIERSSIGGTLVLGERTILKVEKPHSVPLQLSIDDLLG